MYRFKGRTENIVPFYRVKGKGKDLCLTKHSARKAYCGSGDIVPLTL
jgi:hypothetical protein